jgi:hypothetical protein
MIQNWDRLVLRGVRSSDNEDMGNIISIDKDSLFLMTADYEQEIDYYKRSFHDIYNLDFLSL